MDISASARSYPLKDVIDSKDVFSMLWTSLCCIVDCTNACYCMNFFIRRVYVVNFNVSSTKIMHMLNFLDTFSMGITNFVKFWE